MSPPVGQRWCERLGPLWVGAAFALVTFAATPLASNRAAATAPGDTSDSAPLGAPELPPAGSAGPTGSTADGRLTDAIDLPLTGPGYRFFAPVGRRGTHFVTLELAALLVRAATHLQRVAPGPPVYLGDASTRGGGPLPRHRSHQNGRDLDVIFLAMTAKGAPVDANRFVAYDGAGRCTNKGCDWRFDDARNWHLVRTLLASQAPAVQYIFVSAAIRSRLLRFARTHGEHPTLLERATRVLHQPSDSDDHDDHFHVRIYCPRSVVDAGDHASCVDRAPRWPWLTRDGRAQAIAPLGPPQP